MSRMFAEITKTWNPVTGCEHFCYMPKGCWARRTAKRLRHVERYKDGFKPHFNPSEFRKTFKPDDFVFVCDMGDLFGAWVPHEWIYEVLGCIKKFPRTTFLLLTKNPRRYNEFHIPFNCVCGATIETNRDIRGVTIAPPPLKRKDALVNSLLHPRMVAIEPIMDFDFHVFLYWMKEVAPDFVYVGYDNYNCGLPEPSLTKTKFLIERLSQLTDVRIKTLREKRAVAGAETH